MGCCGDDSGAEDEKFGKSKGHDPEFRGPVKHRSCTDIICCLIFFVFILGYLIVAIFAWLNGNPLTLLHPTDSQGRICGIRYNDLDLSNKTSLFYFDITKCATALSSLKFQCPTKQICVAKCPNEYWTFVTEQAKLTASLSSDRSVKADLVDWSKFICTYGYDPRKAYIEDNVELDQMMLQEKCASYYVRYDSVVGRCIPLVSEAAGTLNSSSTVIQNAEKQNVTSGTLLEGIKPIQWYLEARSIANKVFADLTVAWAWLLVLLSIAAVVSFFWILLMRWIAAPMVWITLFTFCALASFGVYYSYMEWTELKGVADSDRSIISVGFTTDLSTYLALQQTWLAFMIILAVIDFIILVTIIFLRKRIYIATQIIRQASKAIGSMISTIFYPLVTFALVLIIVGFWAMTALFLASTGDPIYKYVDNREASLIAGDQNRTGMPCNISDFSNDTTLSSQVGLMCEFIEYGGESLFHKNVFWLQFVMLFGMLWLMNWVLALGQCTLAGAYSSWYWAWKKPRDVPMFPLYQSFGRALRYHTGSLALGSFIIALVQMVRIILEYVDSKLKKADNKVAKFMMKCLKCCFWCLEKFLKFLNRNAYIMIAIYGKNFCWSAKEAFQLLMRNILRAAVLDKIVDFVLFVGKLVVTASMGVLAWALFTNKLESVVPFQTPNLNYYWMPILITIISTFMVATGFFNTFGMAADTIFLCFLEDLERNDGSEEKPYFMAKGLLKLLGKKNKKAGKSS